MDPGDLILLWILWLVHPEGNSASVVVTLLCYWLMNCSWKLSMHKWSVLPKTILYPYYLICFLICSYFDNFFHYNILSDLEVEVLLLLCICGLNGLFLLLSFMANLPIMTINLSILSPNSSLVSNDTLLLACIPWCSWMDW